MASVSPLRYRTLFRRTMRIRVLGDPKLFVLRRAIRDRRAAGLPPAIGGMSPYTIIVCHKIQRLPEEFPPTMVPRSLLAVVIN